MALDHGVIASEINTGLSPISSIASGITALVGTAPKGPLNVLTWVNGPSDAAQFGDPVPGYTIPEALNKHFGEGGQPVMVVNVFDTATAVTAVASEMVQLAGGVGKLAFPPVGDPVVKHSTGTPTYVKDMDYSIDVYGNIKSLNTTTIALNAQLQVSYNKPNFAAITSSVIIGTIDGSTGARTGFKLLENAFNLFGVEAKLLIAPGFSTLSAVVSEMRYWNARQFSMSIVDAPSGTTIAVGIAGRGPSGSINFNVADQRVVLVLPELSAADLVTGVSKAMPASPFVSGLIGKVDTDEGFHVSPSNHSIIGATGPAVTMTSSFMNDGTDAENLNDNGIVTFLNEGRSGLLLWGNRSSAFPASQHPLTFIPIRRTVDIALRSIQIAARPFLDKPITDALIDSIRESANSYIRSLKGIGALIDGECVYDKNKNPTDQLALGRLKFTLRWMAPPPAQRIEFESFVDVTLLSNIATT